MRWTSLWDVTISLPKPIQIPCVKCLYLLHAFQTMLFVIIFIYLVQICVDCRFPKMWECAKTWLYWYLLRENDTKQASTPKFHSPEVVETIPNTVSYDFSKRSEFDHETSINIPLYIDPLSEHVSLRGWLVHWYIPRRFHIAYNAQGVVPNYGILHCFTTPMNWYQSCQPLPLKWGLLTLQTS